MSEKTRFMPLDEAIRDVIKDGDRINPYALYPNDKKKAILYPEETGYSEVQNIGRDKKLKFFYSPDKKGVTTFWGSTTSTKVILMRKTGAENGEVVIYKACQPFSNLKMGLKARATLDEDILYLRDKKITNLRLQEDNEIAWLSSSYVATHSGIAGFGMRFVLHNDVHYYTLFHSYGYATSNHYGVRPAVSSFLNNNILVDMEKSEKLGIWQLIPKK